MWSHQIGDEHELFKVELFIGDSGKTSIFQEGPDLAATWAAIAQVFPLIVESALKFISPRPRFI